MPLFWPHESLRELWQQNHESPEWTVSTQPWVSALLYSLCRALDVRRAVELGCYKGVTSAWLVCAIEANGGGTLTIVDSDEKNLREAESRLAALLCRRVTVTPVHQPTLEYVTQIPSMTQFIFLDDDKEAIPAKLAVFHDRCPGALLAIHDVDSFSDDMKRSVFYLATPALFGSGHLGLVRC